VYAYLYTTVIMCQSLFLPIVLSYTVKVNTRNSLFFSVTQCFEKAKE